MTPVAAIALTSALTALSALPLDVMLPSFGAIADEYETSVDAVASLVGYFAIAFSMLQLVVGPLSDRIGRQRVLIFGLAIATIGAIGGTLAQTYTAHLAFRLIQACGCSCFVLAQAILQDTFPGETGLRARIFNVTFGGLCIACSPLLGAVLQENFGWRASFWLFSAIGAGVFLQVLSHPSDRNHTSTLTLASCARRYLQIATNRAFFAYTLLGAMAFASHFAFVILSPSLFIEALKFSSYDYAYTLLLYGAIYLLGGFVANHASRQITVFKQIQLGIALLSVASVVMTTLYVWLGDHFATVIAPMLLATLGTTLIRPAAATLSMKIFETHAGTAAAAAGAIRFSMAGIISIGVSSVPLSKFLLLALLLLSAAAICMAIQWVQFKRDAAEFVC
ncbi:MFS transporter [Pandoraea sp. NPDC087047]|uniref:MFS transporter n=1 Tax=Pandoraea sp. NPDC087047 TaxID=3364390 RepID=UPI00380271CA